MIPVPRIVIAGLGSPHGDDRAGWLAIERLNRQGLLRRHADKLRAVACRAPAAELPALLMGAELAVLIDAVAGDGAPGTLYRLSGERSLTDLRASSTHGIGLAESLRLARVLDGGPRVLTIYGVEIARATAGETAVSGPVAAALDRVVEQVLRDIRHYLGRV